MISAFLAVWQSFWGELDTPSSFPDDWYGAATNQGTHWAIGLVLSSAICQVFFVIFGEMPYREVVWLTVVSGYLLHEIRRQGWDGVDTITDTMFVSLGAAFPLVSLKEIGTGAERSLAPKAESGLLLLAATLIIYAAHIIPRLVRHRRREQGK